MAELNPLLPAATAVPATTSSARADYDAARKTLLKPGQPLSPEDLLELYGKLELWLKELQGKLRFLGQERNSYPFAS